MILKEKIIQWLNAEDKHCFSQSQKISITLYSFNTVSSLILGVFFFIVYLINKSSANLIFALMYFLVFISSLAYLIHITEGDKKQNKSRRSGTSITYT